MLSRPGLNRFRLAPDGAAAFPLTFRGYRSAQSLAAVTLTTTPAPRAVAPRETTPRSRSGTARQPAGVIRRARGMPADAPGHDAGAGHTTGRLGATGASGGAVASPGEEELQIH